MTKLQKISSLLLLWSCGLLFMVEDNALRGYCSRDLLILRFKSAASQVITETNHGHAPQQCLVMTVLCVRLVTERFAWVLLLVSRCIYTRSCLLWLWLPKLMPAISEHYGLLMDKAWPLYYYWSCTFVCKKIPPPYLPFHNTGSILDHMVWSTSKWKYLSKRDLVKISRLFISYWKTVLIIVIFYSVKLMWSSKLDGINRNKNSVSLLAIVGCKVVSAWSESL